MQKHRPLSRKASLQAAQPSAPKTPRRRGKPQSPRKGSLPPPVPFDHAPQDCGGFVSLLLQRFSWSQLQGLTARKHPAGRPPHRLSRAQLLLAVIFHYSVSFAGDLAEHAFWLFGIELSNGTLSERRQALPLTVFTELLGRVLRPLTGLKDSSQACFRRWRLVAIDGVSYSLANTPTVKRKCPKGGNQKGRAAFAKLQCAALVELVMHNPLAARFGWRGESEWQLALRLLAHLPAQCLLLADRLYGCTAFLVQALPRLQQLGGHYLVRVKLGSSKVQRVVRRFADGSRLVEVGVSDPANRRRQLGSLRVREIIALIHRPGFRSFRVRLWTSLPCSEASARELVPLYMARWEQELYFREIKHYLGRNKLLRSQTPETGAQEVAAMIIGSSLVAHERARLEPGEALTHRISFIKTWELLQPLWLALRLGADLFSAAQKQELCERFYALAARQVMDEKRARSCPRVLKQPVSRWPKKKKQRSAQGPVNTSVLHPTQ